MPTKSRNSLAQTWSCPDCAHRLVLVVDDAGQERTLDTSILTWVISGRRDDAGRAIVVRSGGYPEHACRVYDLRRTDGARIHE